MNMETKSDKIDGFRKQLRLYVRAGVEALLLSAVILCMLIAKTYAFLPVIVLAHASNIALQMYLSVGMENIHRSISALSFYRRSVFISWTLSVISMDAYYVVCVAYGLVHCASTVREVPPIYAVATWGLGGANWCTDFYHAYGIPDLIAAILVLYLMIELLGLVSLMQDLLDPSRDGVIRMATVGFHGATCLRTMAWSLVACTRTPRFWQWHLFIAMFAALEAGLMFASLRGGRLRRAVWGGLVALLGVNALISVSGGGRLGLEKRAVLFMERWGVLAAHDASALAAYLSSMLFANKKTPNDIAQLSRDQKRLSEPRGDSSRMADGAMPVASRAPGYHSFFRQRNINL